MQMGQLSFQTCPVDRFIPTHSMNGLPRRQNATTECHNLITTAGELCCMYRFGRGYLNYHLCFPPYTKIHSLRYFGNAYLSSPITGLNEPVVFSIDASCSVNVFSLCLVGLLSDSHDDA